MNTRVFIAPHMAKGYDLPEGVEAVEWVDLCHGQRGRDFLWITHRPVRSPSRWTIAVNKLPWHVIACHVGKRALSSNWESPLARRKSFEEACKAAVAFARKRWGHDPATCPSDVEGGPCTCV